MMCMELNLSVKAPHNVVFFDGSFVTPLVYINLALNTLNEAAEDLNAEFKKRLKKRAQIHLPLQLKEVNCFIG